MVDQVAVRYGQRPSALLGISDPFEALDFDIAVMLKGSRLERGEPVDYKSYREKWDAGFNQLKAMQQRVIEAYRKSGKV